MTGKVSATAVTEIFKWMAGVALMNVRQKIFNDFLSIVAKISVGACGMTPLTSVQCLWRGWIRFKKQQEDRNDPESDQQRDQDDPGREQNLRQITTEIEKEPAQEWDEIREEEEEEEEPEVCTRSEDTPDYDRDWSWHSWGWSNWDGWQPTYYPKGKLGGKGRKGKG
eukprot:s3267_g4.t1